MNDSNLFSLAVVCYLGYGTEKYPRQNQKNLADKFGSGLASELEPEIKKLLDELESFKPDLSEHSIAATEVFAKEKLRRKNPSLGEEDIDAHWSKYSWLHTACILAKEEMSRKHPELSEEAIDALEWAFSWWQFHG